MRSPAGRRPPLTLQALETRDTPAGVWSAEPFNAGPALPADWDVRSTGDLRPTVTTTGGPGPAGALSLPAGTRAWEESVLPADSAVQARVRLDGTAVAHLFLRGQRLPSSNPSFYAATLDEDGSVRVLKVVNGVQTVLGTVIAPAGVTGTWLTATLRARGSELTLELRRPTGEYLGPTGVWQAGPTVVVRVTDTAIARAGRAGLARPAGGRGPVLVDDFRVLLAADPPAEVFDSSPAGGLPAGWSAWSSDAGSRPAVGADSSSGGQVVRLNGSSGSAGRAWVDAELPSDVRVRAAVQVASLVPGLIFARGSNLHSNTPTYYAAAVTRGTEIKLLRVINGASRDLATVRTRTYLSQVRLDLSLIVQGDRLQVRVRRADTGKWLNTAGDWVADPAAALDARDGAIAGPGRVGVGRMAGAAGVVALDDFSALPADGDITAPVPTAGVLARAAVRPGTVAGLVQLRATVKEAGPVDRVEFYVDGGLVSRRSETPYRDDFETRNLANGRHTLTVRVWDAAGNAGESSVTFTVHNRRSAALPRVPRHYSHVRYAALAYAGNPMGATEQRLLRESVDLVVPNERYLTPINTTSPATPQLVYSNLSNLYDGLLTDWLAYADRTHGDREAAFYHVAGPTPFTGDSASSRPVSWFWNVSLGPAAGPGMYRSLTAAARDSKANDLAFGAADQALAVGHPDRFRELNVTVARPAGSGWAGVLEYPSAVDAAGQPVAWKPLTTVSDSTNGFRQSGQMTFDPPADWAPAVVSGSAARLYYVRVRTTAGPAAAAPVASSILGRDFVQANGRTVGTIPAFDAAADVNHDGYLNTAEYARRKAGFDARFESESRWFYPGYGQMRYATNPGGEGVAAWAGDYHRRLLAARPLADGLFMDNSAGRLPTDGAVTVESRDTFASDYGTVLGAVNRAVAPRWVLANTVAGGADADRVARQVPATIEEYALRPLAHTWSQFQEIAALVQRRLALTEPSGYLILDTLSAGGSPTDPRTRIAALAYYYLLADPDSTFLMTWGGEEPASAWSRHWFDAIGYDIGQPNGAWGQFATGADPTAPTRSYQVLSRAYDKALVLYKPLSYAAGQGRGSTADATATTHQLNGSYRALNADGTLGPAVRSVTLRNGEGAVLVKA